MKKLTHRQREIFEFILETIQRRGRPPTFREIGQKFSITSTNAVRDHLLALKRKGFLMDTPKGHGIEIAPEYLRSVQDVPILGKVPAGPLIEAIEDFQGSILEKIVGQNKEDVFALKVWGDSMIEAGIYDGDYVIVRKDVQVEQGEIGVAYVDGEATVKRIFREDGRYRLQPENSSMDPIYVLPSENFQVIGKVIAVVRKI